jgi:hypothetical protein
LCFADAILALQLLREPIKVIARELAFLKQRNLFLRGLSRKPSTNKKCL